MRNIRRDKRKLKNFSILVKNMFVISDKHTYFSELPLFVDMYTSCIKKLTLYNLIGCSSIDYNIKVALLQTRGN